MSNNHDDLLLIRGIIDQLCAISVSQVSLLVNQSKVLHGALPLISSLHVPTAVVEITDPECCLSEGGPEGKIKKVNQSIIKPGSANVSVRGGIADCSERTQAAISIPMISNVTRGKVLDDHLKDTNECNVGRVCTNQSKPLSPK